MRKFIFTYKSRGLGQAKPEPSREWRLWPGLRFEETKAASGQAKAGAFRPSWAGTALMVGFSINTVRDELETYIKAVQTQGCYVRTQLENGQVETTKSQGADFRPMYP
jgi:hypothetical protein